jgi:predicted transcriptional regulator|tara:strand:+ start:22 stop:714 length:693 start_codon:yes stop_codon:yes gene_type:complete
MSSTHNIKRERSRNKIFIALKNEPKRFTDLQKDTGLSAVGLTSILKIMLEEKEIKLDLIDNNKKYKLTKKGTISGSDLNYMSIGLTNITSRNGKYYPMYSQLKPLMLSSSLPWGIDSDLTVDGEIDSLNLLTRSDVFEIEKLLFKKILKNITKRKLNEKLYGEMILGFSIKIPELIQSIKKQSLDYMENMSKEELSLLNKYEHDPESMTQKEFARMNILREKTRKQLQNL